MYCMDDISHDLIKCEDVEVEPICLRSVLLSCFVINIMGLCLALVL